MTENKNEKNNSIEKDFSSKLQLAWEGLKKNWIWTNIGAFIASLLFTWTLYIFDVINLTWALIITIIPPFAIFLRFRFQTIKHPIKMNKFMLIVVVGFVFTIPLFLLLGYILIVAPWAPINIENLPEWLGYVIFLLIFVLIYPFVGYFLYRFGEKKEWHISPYY